MVAHTFHPPTYFVKVEPALTYHGTVDLGWTNKVPPDKLLQPYAAITLPNGVNLHHVECVIYNDWLIEDAVVEQLKKGSKKQQ